MAEIDEKSKLATMAHMNKDHALDLGLYLRFVNGLSAEQLAAEGEPAMVDMDLTAMHIRTAASGTVHVVPLDPPLATWAERRPRLVALALDARKAYGVPLPEHPAPPGGAAGRHGAALPAVPFGPPVGLDIVVFGSVLFFAWMGTLVLSGRDETAARVWTRVLDATLGPARQARFAFGGPDGFRRLVRGMVLPVAAIHLAEMWWLDRTRLAPRGMRPFSRDWSLWMGSTMWDGARGFMRFDRLAAEMAAQSAKQ